MLKILQAPGRYINSCGCGECDYITADNPVKKVVTQRSAVTSVFVA
jgi:hypothetical protein